MARNPDIDRVLLDILVDYIGTYQLKYSKDAQGNRAYARALTLLTTQVLDDIDNGRDQLIVDALPTGRRRVILPLVISSRSKNTSRDTMYKLDDGHELDSADDNFLLGAQFIEDGAVSYIGGFEPGTTIGRIQANVLDNEVILEHGKDFVVVGSTIVFVVDPFTQPQYSQYDTADDTLMLLWGADMETSSDYGAAFFGHLLRINEEDSDRYRNILESAWTLAFQSSTPYNINAFTGDVLNIPTTTKAGRVDDISDTHVIVEGITYELTAAPLTGLKIGQHLPAGSFLQDGVELFMTTAGELNNNPDLIFDLAVLRLSHGFSIDGPLSLQARSVPVTYEGLDANGNGRIRFELDPTDDIHWTNIWKRSEAQGVDMLSLIPGIGEVSPTTPRGTVIGTINPALFVINNFLGNNLFVLKVESDVVPDNTRISYLALILDYLGANIAGIISMTADAGDESDYDMQEVVDVASPFYATSAVDIAGSSSTLHYRDNITTIWVPSS